MNVECAGAKLPITWYPQDFIKVPMTDMRMRPVPSLGYPGRTYKFYKGKAVFPFGYGLSYSNHIYNFVHVSHNIIDLTGTSQMSFPTLSNSTYRKVSDLNAVICDSRKVHVRVGVENHGKMASKHPVLLFVRPGRVTNENNPVKQLVGFESVSLEAGERREVEYVISPCEHLSRAEMDGAKVVDEGSHFLVIEDQEYPISVII